MLSTASLNIQMVQGDNTPLNLTFRDYSTKDLEDLSDKTLEAVLKLSSGTEIELDVRHGHAPLREFVLVVEFAQIKSVIGWRHTRRILVPIKQVEGSRFLA